MKQYIGTKIIKAKEMTRGKYNKLRGWTIPENENPADEGYLVEYSDGYISWSPKKQFEEAYRLCDNMTFGLAIEALKKGFKVARKGWNGKGMFVVYQKGYPEGIPCNKQTAEAWGINEGDLFVCNPYLQIKNVNGSHSMWVPSIDDVLAEDWCIVRPECRCSACKHSRKVEGAEYDKTYECTAEHYDLEAYTCFEAK